MLPLQVVRFLAALIEIYSLVLLVRIILSWIPNLDRSNPLVDALHQVTDPVLEPVRRMLPSTGMIDLSPLIVLLLLHLLRTMLLGLA